MLMEVGLVGIGHWAGGVSGAVGLKRWGCGRTEKPACCGSFACRPAAWWGEGGESMGQGEQGYLVSMGQGEQVAGLGNIRLLQFGSCGKLYFMQLLNRTRGEEGGLQARKF